MLLVIASAIFDTPPQGLQGTLGNVRATARRARLQFTMVNDEVFDVAIIGLGPVGAVAANLCGQAGLKTLVIERGTEPYLLPRAIHFDAEIMRVFQSLELAETIAPLTRPLGGSVYVGCDGHPIRIFRSQDTRSRLGWPASNLFYQPEIEKILRDGIKRYPNVSLRLGNELKLLAVEADGTRLHFENFEGATCQATARFVLACDGASSPTRKLLGIKLGDMTFEERWLVLDAMVNGPMRWPPDLEIPEVVRNGQFSLMVCDPSRPATIIPGAGRHRRWEYMLLPDETDAMALESGAISSFLSRWIDPAEVEIVRAAVYRFHGLIADKWRADNIFLLGDAAHQTPPFFGQGMCHGIRDAAQLIWKLQLVLSERSDGKILDSYQQEREGHVRTIITASVAAGGAVCIRDRAAALDRDDRFRAQEAARGDEPLAMTDVVPPITHGILNSATGGMRLPQPTVRIKGRLVKSDDLLGGRFTILALCEVPLSQLAPDCATAWDALNGHLVVIPDAEEPSEASAGMRKWLSERNALWVIVRPDRYVFGTANTASELRALLRELTHQLMLKTQR